MRLHVIALACTLALSACSSSTGTDGPVVSVTGTWRYSAVQTSGLRVTYQGTVDITQQSGATFSGGLDAQASSAQGGVARVSAVVSGRVLNGNAVDFDAESVDGTRRYVGTITGDSITGSWASEDLSTSGTYGMKRLK